VKNNVEVRIDICLEEPMSQTLKIEYVNESDTKLKIEKLNPHRSIKLYNSRKQLIPQSYGSFAQGIQVFLELAPNSKKQHRVSLRKNYEIASQGRYYLVYEIKCELLGNCESEAPCHFYLEGNIEIDFGEGMMFRSEFGNRRSKLN
jgi:hypothetical protein